jgi:phosphoribosylformimino-5-aminoimidazole carboxamide ribotide isomerase
MLILPAIDLMNGRCVRLEKGAFAHATLYEADPLTMAAAFEGAGAQWVHVIDLDGARTGKEGNREWVLRIAAETDLKVQSGGGLRSEDEVAELLEGGVERAIVGSMAVRDPDAIDRLVTRFGSERLTVALDLRLTEAGPEIAIDGWQTSTEDNLQTLLGIFGEMGVRHILITDISRDGMLEGPNTALYSQLTVDFPDFAFQASGGVSALQDIADLRETGAAAAIVGRAIYEGQIPLQGLFDAG